MASTHFVIVKDDISNTSMKNLVNELRNVEGINNVLGVNSLTGLTIPNYMIPEKFKNNFENNGYQMIMLNSKYQTASQDVSEQVDKIKSIVEKYDSEGYLTGEAVLTKDLTKISDRDFRMVNIASIAIVFLIIALVFKSIGIPIILIASIELAILINMSLPFTWDKQYLL